MFQAKFKISSVEHFEHDNAKVRMQAAMGDNSFTKYTPSGSIDFLCCNPEVNKQLVPGKTFLITFEEE